MKKNCISLNISYLVSKESIGKDGFGKLFGLNRGAIGSYIDKKATPKIDTLQKISEKYNLSLDDLVNKDLNDYSFNEEIQGNLIEDAKSIEDAWERLMENSIWRLKFEAEAGKWAYRQAVEFKKEQKEKN